MDEEVSDEEYQNRLQVLKYGLEQDFNFSTHSIPEEVIDAFVKEIIVHPDCFVWKRNIFADELRLQVSGRKGNSSATLIESPTLDNGSTGSDCRQIRKKDYFQSLARNRQNRHLPVLAIFLPDNTGKHRENFFV